jgi:hypothetical protein
MITLPDAPAAADRTSLLRSFLVDQDVPCPQCGYNLRNLRAERCPECGEQLVLRVNVAEPRQGALIAGLVGLSAGAGLSGLLLIYIGIQVLYRGRESWPEMYRFVAITGGGFVVEGGALLLWLWLWRRIRRRSLASRALWAGVCWALTLANIIFFSLTIR